MRVGCLVALLTWIVGCSDNRAVEIARWRISGDVARGSGSVSLPAHLDVRDEVGTYELSTTVELPARMRSKSLHLVINELPAVAELSVNGTMLPSIAPQGTRYRTRGPLEWEIPAQLATGDTLELAIHVRHGWTQSAWWDAVPQLLLADEVPASTTLVHSFNLYVAFAALICLVQLALTGLAIYMANRRHPVYLWLALQNLLAAYFPAFVLGFTQPIFGVYDAPILGATLIGAITASLWFTHAFFDLARPSRWWLVLGAVGVCVAAVCSGPFVATRVTGTITVSIVGVLLAYQLIVSTRLAMRHSDRWMARFLWVSWILLALSVPSEATHWLGFGSLASGASTPSLGLLMFSFGMSLQLSRRHFLALEREAELRQVADDRLGALQHLNQELRRQVADRSTQLLTGLALAGTDATHDKGLAIGDRVHQRYEVVAELGRGGMGTVYEVLRLADRQHFALKVTNEVSGVALARLAREALVASRIDHANVVGIVDVDVSASGVLYIVMELVPGRSLRAFASQFGDPSWTLDILAQLASGLAALHAAGIVHRDLKPANLLVITRADGDPLLKIVDFGVSRPLRGFEHAPDHALEVEDREQASAKSENAQTTATVRIGIPRKVASPPFGVTRGDAVVGTPAYIAPEVLQGDRNLSTSADVFSFGIIAWEVLADAQPFPKPLIQCLLDDGRLPPAASLATKWTGDPEVVSLIDRCVTAEPTARPTAAELAEVLTRARQRLAESPVRSEQL
ncbi:MAG TPA: protein kinase [Kofleriaceae bacterium]